MPDPQQDEFEQYKVKAVPAGDDEFVQYKVQAGEPPKQGQGFWSTLGDAAMGAVKGLNHTLIGDSPMFEPKNTAQKAGYYGEQGAEFLIPTGFEEQAAAKGAELLPKFAKFIKPAAKMGTAAIETGARNMTQGGDFKEGAEAGVAGAGLSAAGQAIAPAVAESALGIGKRLRGYGKTPGKAVLEEINGVRPATILKNATQKSGQLTSDLEGMAAAHPGRISLQPAIDTIDQEIAKATRQNNATAVGQLKNVRAALTKDISSGLPLSPNQKAPRALDLKRGLRNQFVKNWNPEVHGAEATSAAKGASRQIDAGLDTALGPKFKGLNQRVSSLIPVAERAESVERNAGIPQRIMHRVGAHTGALAGAIGGGALGYREGGTTGALKMGGLGLVLPELVASPTGQMALARTLNSEVPVRLGKGAALQFLRDSGKKKRQNENEE